MKFSEKANKAEQQQKRRSSLLQGNGSYSKTLSIGTAPGSEFAISSEYRLKMAGLPFRGQY